MLLRGTFLNGDMMENKLYVGNLPYSFTDNDMQRTFGAYGSVDSAKVIMDRDSGRSKGFGFVEMATAAEAQAAVSAAPRASALSRWPLRLRHKLPSRPLQGLRLCRDGHCG